MRLEGFAELDKALGQLPKATAKNTLRRVLKKAAVPVDDAASHAAPTDTGRLELSVVTGTQLTRSQRGAAARLTDGGFRSASKNYVEVYVGTKLSRGMFQEFGTFKDVPNPWFRPAWEATQDIALGIIKSDLGAEIEKAAKRYAKKLGRA